MNFFPLKLCKMFNSFCSAKFWYLLSSCLWKGWLMLPCVCLCIIPSISALVALAHFCHAALSVLICILFIVVMVNSSDFRMRLHSYMEIQVGKNLLPYSFKLAVFVSLRMYYWGLRLLTGCCLEAFHSSWHMASLVCLLALSRQQGESLTSVC